MPPRISGDWTSAVLDAAASCYLRLSVSKTTAADIARAAGMSRATLYRRFGSHEAIFMAVLERESAALAAEAAEYLADIADPRRDLYRRVGGLGRGPGDQDGRAAPDRRDRDPAVARSCYRQRFAAGRCCQRSDRLDPADPALVCGYSRASGTLAGGHPPAAAGLVPAGRHRYEPVGFDWTYPDIETEFSDYVGRYSVAPAAR